MVTLKWLEAAAGRPAGFVEEWDYSANVALVDSWVAAGWCRIEAKGKAMSGPPEDKAIKSAETRKK